MELRMFGPQPAVEHVLDNRDGPWLGRLLGRIQHGGAQRIDETRCITARPDERTWVGALVGAGRDASPRRWRSWRAQCTVFSPSVCARASKRPLASQRSPGQSARLCGLMSACRTR
jgi:hypothetical protein